MRPASAAILLVLLLAGCASRSPAPTDVDGPALSAAVLQAALAAGDLVSGEGANVTLRWHHTLGAGAEVPLVNGNLLGQYDAVGHEVAVDASVRTIQLRLAGDGVAVARLRDDAGNLLCVARLGRVCSTLVQASDLVRFPVEVVSLSPRGVTVQLDATLSPLPPVLGTDGTLAGTGFDVHRSDAEGGEPTLAVASGTRVLVVAGTAVLRLEPDGTFTDVTPPVEAALAQTLDPFLYGDAATGRIYLTQLSQCLRVWWTDDAGDSWGGNPEVCAGPEQHHQKVAVGPGPLADVAGQGAPRAIHIATMNLASWLTTDEVAVFSTRSLDGGLSWSQNPAKVVDADGTAELRNIGNIATLEEPGVVLAIGYRCDRFVDADYNGVSVGRSTDYGVSWTWQRIAPGGGRCEGIDPGIWAHGQEVVAAWEDMAAGQGHVWVARSQDGGRVWGEPVAVPTPGLRSFAFTDVAFEDGHVAVAFLATPDTDLGPTQAPGWARWYPYAALLETRGWQTYRLQDDPVQVGPICMDGPKCLDGARNLLDFIDVRVDPALGAVVAYPDGCEGDCAWPYQSRDAFLRVAILRGELA